MYLFMLNSLPSSLLFLLWSSVCLRLTRSYPGYHILIPNGDRIPNVCDRSTNWLAIGHENPDGGGKLSSFGLHLMQHRRTWTVALCQMDSDGDGLTNGEELGDPDCKWRATADLPPRISDQRLLSHPGICEPFDSKRCAGKNGFLLAICPEKLLLTKKCAAPPSPRHSYVSHYTMSHGLDQYSVGDQIQFECETDYVMIGSAKVHCQQNRTWTPLPGCHGGDDSAQGNTCPPPRSMPINSFVSSSTSTALLEGSRYPAGSLFHYECNAGYRPSGHGTTVCQQNGNWSDVTLMCTLVDATGQAVVKRSAISNRLGDFPSAAQTMQTCVMPSPLPQGVVLTLGTKPDGRYMPGDVVTLGCQNGYISEGCPYTMCQDIGSFTRILIKCKSSSPVVSCGPPPTPLNAQLSPVYSTSKPGPDGRYQVGNSVTFVCNPGFNSAGDNLAPAVCQADGTWAACSLVCIGTAPPPSKTCEDPINPPNSFRQPSSAAPGSDRRFRIGDSIVFSCCDGYTPAGNGQITCQASGTWSQLSFSCQLQAACSVPPMPPNARLVPGSSSPATSNKYRPGDAILYDCADGYSVSGNSQINCQRDGTWSSLSFTCQPQQKNCPPPQFPSNSCPILEPTPNSMYLPGDIFVFACDFGYAPSGSQGKLTGSGQITCQPTGTWTTTDFRCEPIIVPSTQPQTRPPPTRPPPTRPSAVSCQSPDLPMYSAMMKDSRANSSPDRYVEGDYVQYGCQSGYTIFGTIQCQADGSWSSASMTCQPVSRGILSLSGSGSVRQLPSSGSGSCTPPRVPSNATPLSSSSSYSTGEFIQYACKTGYTVSGVTTCLRDGTWSGSSFVCELTTVGPPPVTVGPPTTYPPGPGRVTCLAPVVPENAQIIAQLVTTNGDTAFPVGAFFIFLCNDGYRMIGDPTIICNTDGRWTESPFCVSDYDSAY